MSRSAWKRYLKQKRFQYSSVVLSHDRNDLSYAIVFNRRLQPVLTITDYREVPNKESFLQGQKGLKSMPPLPSGGLLCPENRRIYRSGPAATVY